MMKYISRWYQEIFMTPRPDIEEAVKEVREALETLNEKVQHLEKIEGVSGSISIRGGYRQNECIHIGSTRNFHAKLNYVAEHHSRKF